MSWTGNNMYTIVKSRPCCSQSDKMLYCTCSDTNKNTGYNPEQINSTLSVQTLATRLETNTTIVSHKVHMHSAL